MRLAQALAALPIELSSEQQIKIVQLLLGQQQGSGFDGAVQAFAVQALSTKLRTRSGSRVPAYPRVPATNRRPGSILACSGAIGRRKR
jgi:hypothetical protein